MFFSFEKVFASLFHDTDITFLCISSTVIIHCNLPLPQTIPTFLLTQSHPLVGISQNFFGNIFYITILIIHITDIYTYT